LAWREGSGQKPAGAVAGGGFTVVSGMTSLTGASGEDFASILRSLGYRMERRPKPAEPPSGSAAAVDAAPQTEVAADAGAASPAPSPLDGSESVAASETSDAAVHAAGTETASDEASASPLPALEFIVPPSPVDSAAAGAAPSDTTSAAAAAEQASEPAAQEPPMVEVWRPGRPEGRRGSRPRHRGNRVRTHKDRPALQPPQATAMAAAPAADATLQRQGAQSGSASGKPERQPRQGRRQAVGPRPDRPPRKRERPPVKRFERREKAPDPNSPFAKLAALKAQLEADAKERH